MKGSRGARDSSMACKLALNLCRRRPTRGRLDGLWHVHGVATFKYWKGACREGFSHRACSSFLFYFFFLIPLSLLPSVGCLLQRPPRSLHDTSTLEAEVGCGPLCAHVTACQMSGLVATTTLNVKLVFRRLVVLSALLAL